MILYLKAIVKGEPDTTPFTRIFSYQDSSDELIFFNTIGIIREKIQRHLKINANEALMVYVAYVVDQLRARKPVSVIKENASKILIEDQVMIGVSETLRNIIFEVTLDNLGKAIFFLNQPIVINNTNNNDLPPAPQSSEMNCISSLSSSVTTGKLVL